MKFLKHIANLAILSPIAIPLALTAFLCWTFLLAGSSNDAEGFKISFRCAIALYFLGIGTGLAFLVGIVLHAVVAMKTHQPCRWAWWLIFLVGCVAAAVVRPTGTVVGGILIVLLFTIKPFKIMRRGGEPTAGGNADGVLRSAGAVHAASRRWLSFFLG